MKMFSVQLMLNVLFEVAHVVKCFHICASFITTGLHGYFTAILENIVTVYNSTQVPTVIKKPSAKGVTLSLFQHLCDADNTFHKRISC